MTTKQQNAINNILDRVKVVDDVKTIEGDVDICFLGLTELPDLSNVIINGTFYCNNNNLTSLKGCPKIINGAFDCMLNKLTSLKGAPKIINGNFSCYGNKLSSLQGGPQAVNGSFDCSNNQITSLEYAPSYINGSFYGKYNPWPKEYNIAEPISSQEYFELLERIKEQAYLKDNPINFTAIDIEI